MTPSRRRIQASSSTGIPYEMTVLEAQAQSQKLLQEVRDLLRADHDGSNLHIVFSASCDQRNRLLQQTVVQLTASWVGQRGPITQIVSGCSESERLRVMTEPKLYYDFRRHFTPSFAVNPEPGANDTYAPYNKPFGLRHFLQNAFPRGQHELIALIDGDFFFFRPLEANTGRNMSKYYHGRRNALTIEDTVVDGVALAQDWNALKGGFFAKDKADVLKKVCDGLPCGNVSHEDGTEYYGSIGPPYIMTRRDALRMVDDYCHLCVKTREVSSEWIAEMFAYSVAVANNGIKHTALSHLGVSSPSFKDGGHEYWDFVVSTMANPCEDNLQLVLPKDPPVAVHACQWIGDFYKSEWPKTIANCDSPLFKILPSTAWSEINSTVEVSKQQTRREEVWAMCTLTKIMNHALGELKQRMCHSGFNSFRSIDAVRVDKTV
ncbi:hypothetical protein PF005_g13634 [Phytophthora fragariae]|uniref:Uncharacterized protein n=1 Tax=Phytophthora fragariae TaxID=53985 RepID=A0A6A3TUI0_9STRA|nr:hypothetical protein PF009_g14829 [Phytophthora fragariae]KAE9004708.1 hypothetical protein PF011_g12336 [Phytophthora fragariae]KAE9104430.1 hypothetical protein PF010_g13383 [Phytophthora fragariae]KAE9105754.1 hypothetical protein PF007_g13644 [Phytophthora fragariae]KAE9141917.1 hypothetical protein PF006_g12926 [Phytophthora fragariae]